MNDVPIAKVNAVIDRELRDSWGKSLAALAHRVGDLQLAEDALQEAALSAWKNWPSKGIPNSPGAWLYQVALRKAIDQIRRRQNFDTKREEIQHLQRLQSEVGEPDELEEIPDERLRLIFTCCHPAIDQNSSVALTLRTVGGLRTNEIARAFLVEKDAMAKRLSRAKAKIRDAGIPYRVPPPELWKERLDSVLAVVYLIFNEGYHASSGRVVLRRDLCEEAIHLARVLKQLVPEDPEVAGLLALQLSHHARHRARLAKDGSIVALEDQDRSLWRKEEVKEAQSILSHALTRNEPGSYQVQAAISLLHSTSDSFESTDWIQIEALYRELERYRPGPVVQLNRIVAHSLGRGPESALQQLEPLSEALANYLPYYAARADFLRRAERWQDAALAYQTAIELSQNDSEIQFFLQRKKRCENKS